MFSRYYSIAYQDSGKTVHGTKLVEYKALSTEDAEEAFSCLQKSAALGLCEAHKVLIWLYQFGNNGSNMPVKKDSKLQALHTQAYEEKCE